MVSQQYGADAIIDDGLLISHGKVIAGTSAKKEPTKIASVKHALFMNPSQVNEIKKVLKRNKIKCLMILGTSDGTVSYTHLDVYKRQSLEDIFLKLTDNTSEKEENTNESDI